MKNTDLKERLRKWDGKHTSYLIAIYQQQVDDPAFVDDIIQLYLKHIELQPATTWIIKHYVDNGHKLSQTQIDKTLSRVNTLEQWEAQLHILQLIPQFPISTKTAEYIEPFVREKLTSEKKFVKAAAYEAYYEIVKVYPALNNEFRILCEEALANESASVRAKVKNIYAKMTASANTG
jgi:hypothetical protein